MADLWKNPTPEQNDQAVIVQHEVVETLNRLCREGIDPRVVLAGLGAAAADTVTSIFGPTAVAPWFEKQGEIVRELQRGSGN